MARDVGTRIVASKLKHELQRLRSCVVASAPPPSPSPAALTVRLGDAYGRIEELVAPVAATLSSARWRGVVEAVLDPSVVTLDLCGLLELHPTGPARERVTPTAPTAELEAGGGPGCREGGRAPGQERWGRRRPAR